MNSDFLRWLLNVKAIPKGSESLRLAWEHPWPNWVWTLLFIGAGVLALWSYSNLVGRRTGRGILATARFLLLFLILILISGPMLELPRETVEQDWVLMLADRSASMSIRDAAEPGDDSTTAARISRDEQLRESLADQEPLLAALARRKNVVWMGFHAGAFNLAENQSAATQPASVGDALKVPGASVPELATPTGRRTNLEAALEQALLCSCFRTC